MKRWSGTLSVRLLVWLLAAVLLTVSGAWAKPTTPEQARTVVLNWLGLDAAPLGAALGRQIKEVQTFKYGDTPAYYVVHLNPSGLVFVPADDLVEPIIGFLPAGQYDPSPTNPLGALVSRDIPGRVVAARAVAAQGLEALAPATSQARARRKWAWLAQPAAGTEALELGLPSISDVRVASFVLSRWSQTTVGGLACYNYYTPPYAAGDPRNYPCGCVATAMAQLMRYWQYPTAGIGVHTFTISVDGIRQSRNTRGGDGAGGPYDWANMVLDPENSGVNDTQRRAIGALTADAGVSVNMSYTADSSGVPDMSGVGAAFTGTFKYSNARYGISPDNLPEAARNAMINPNLHARYPVLLQIRGAPGGHAVVCDGYGYNLATMYHHLNLGWAGADDAWYNLPTIDTSQGTFTTVDLCVYNVYKPGTGSDAGEIIAGRVTDNSATPKPISGATVTATGTGGPYTAATGANGIYALAQVPSNTTFTVSASKRGYSFTTQTVTTGTSTDGTDTTGNQWPLDFAGSATWSPIAPLLPLLLN